MRTYYFVTTLGQTDGAAGSHAVAPRMKPLIEASQESIASRAVGFAWRDATVRNLLSRALVLRTQFHIRSLTTIVDSQCVCNSSSHQ